MSRDKVKDVVASEVAHSVTVLARVLDHRLAREHGVTDVEALRVTDYETHLRVKLPSGPRYFVVKVSEKF